MNKRSPITGKRIWADEAKRKLERAKSRKIIKTVSGKWIAKKA